MVVDITIDVDVLGIGDAISKAVSNEQDQEALLNNLCETAFYQSGQNYNVLVCNLDQNYGHELSGTVFYASARHPDCTYGIWVFEDGWFENDGAEGSIDWVFEGCYDITGDQGQREVESQRFYDPLNGKNLLDGHDIKPLNLRWFRSLMGFVQQEPVLFNLSIRDNIAYGDNTKQITQDQIEDAA